MTLEERTRVLAKGYRRFGFDYYRPFCRGCRECTPYRVIVNAFEPTRRFRRSLARNADVRLAWGQPTPTQEKFELYVRYQMMRHKAGSASDYSKKDLAIAMMSQMYLAPAGALELTLYLDEKSIGFAAFDLSLDSLSAVYSVYEPTLISRSLGTFIILSSIQKCKELSLPFLNLGLYLEHHPKMAYKGDFFPAEKYRGYNWVRDQD